MISRFCGTYDNGRVFITWATDSEDLLRSRRGITLYYKIPEYFMNEAQEASQGEQSDKSKFLKLLIACENPLDSGSYHKR